MEKPEVEKSSSSDETSQLNRNRSFKSKQLVRSQALRETHSPPRTISPSVVVDAAYVIDDVTTDDIASNDVTTDVAISDKVSSSDERSDVNSEREESRRQTVEIQITQGAWDEPSTEQRQRTKRWLGNKQHSRDLLSNNPRVACVCGACHACPHCRGRRRKHQCPTKQDSGIVCSDECPDCSDADGADARKTNSVDGDDAGYCRCPERKEKPKSISLSRADTDWDLTGPELVQFIKDTLNKNARDRVTLLKIEKELHSLVNDTGRCIVRFPVMSSYGRMLVHRCAALFQLSHNVDRTNNNAVLVSKSGTCGGRIPCTSFREWCTATLPPSPQRHHTDITHAKSILKRDTHSLDEPGAGALSATRSKSLEQREREYERVRRRIFSSDNCTQDESNQWQWLNSGPVKLLTPEGRNKLIKVQSLEGSGPGSKPSGGRGAVSKSHSFGGYGRAPEAPRLLSRQGDLASSSWRLSPSSSGYRTLSLHSTDSVQSPPPGVVSPEPSNAAGAVMWAVTDLSSVPVGALVIHPQTGRPLTHADGSLYHFDPNNPPILDNNVYTYTDKQTDINNEKKRGRLEKQHSFMDNECECQPSEECRSKCCCECRRHDTCHRGSSDKISTQTEQKTHQKPTSPCKNRYEHPVEATNHNPPPDISTNHRPANDTTSNQKLAADNPTNQRSVYDVRQNYNSSSNLQMRTQYETNQRPPSYDSNQKFEPANQRAASDFGNYRPMRLTNQGTPEIQYVNQQYPQRFSHEEVTSPPQAGPPHYIQQDFSQPVGQVKPMPVQDPNMRPMSLGVVYPGVSQYFGSALSVYQPMHSEEQKQAPSSVANSTFTIDPSYPYAPVDYRACAACVEPPHPHPPPPPAPAPAPAPPYALYTPIDALQYHRHYPYQDLQWQNVQSVMQVPQAPKVLVPELYPIMQYPNVPVYPQYNVMYQQMIPQPYPIYQPMQVPDQRRNTSTPLRHSKRNSVSGSSRNTPLTSTPEEKKVPCEDSHHVQNTNPSQNHNVTSQKTSVTSHNASLPSHIANLPSHNANITSQNPFVPSHNANITNKNANTQLPGQNAVVPNQNTLVPNQNTFVPGQNQNPSQNTNVQGQNTNVAAQEDSANHQSCSRDAPDIAAKIKHINDQMSQMHTRDRDRDGYKRDGRRDEWKRRNSGNGILGSYPVGVNGRLVGRPPANNETQLSSAARAIVNSIRNMQAKNNYQDRRPDNGSYRNDRDRPDYRRRDDRQTDRRPQPVYTPPYLLRQMSPGTWCRRSPGPVHPVLNPRRPHPDSRGGRR